MNVVGAGLALACVTSMALVAEGVIREPGMSTLAAGLPTLLIGTLWAGLLRMPGTFRVGMHEIRRGWIASVPLAMANAGVSLAVHNSIGPFFHLDFGHAIACFFAGATVGAFVWLPALLLTLLVFGTPIAWAERQRERGLAGEERGELVIGCTVTVLSLAGLLGGSNRLSTYEPPSTLLNEMGDYNWPAAELLGLRLLILLACLGVATGVTASLLSLVRERARRRFVARVEAGEQVGYRIAVTEEERVLVRVTSAVQARYRVADLHEDLIRLDMEGVATHPAEPLYRRRVRGG
jgi:hypothetical protein